MRRGLVVLVAAGAVACGQPPGAASDTPLTRRVIQPANYRPSPAPLVPAIMVGHTLYLSGGTGGDPETGLLVEGGFEAEFRQIMANMQSVLAGADLDLSHVVSVTVYLADMDDYGLLNELYREYFTTDPLPTRAAVAVTALARGAVIELRMTAVDAG